MILISPGELRHQVNVRGWDQRILAREAGVSEATVSRVLAGHPVRGLTALRMVQAFRRNPAIPELAELVVNPAVPGPRAVWHKPPGGDDSKVPTVTDTVLVRREAPAVQRLQDSVDPP